MSRNVLGEIGSILSALASASGAPERQGALAGVLSSYEYVDTARLSHELKSEWRHLPASTEKEIHGCILGPPIDIATPVLFPVFMLGLKKPPSGDDVHCWIRIALHAEGHEVEGWRYELTDPLPDDPSTARSPRAHFYAHAQRIVGWRRGQVGFDFYAQAHPGTEDPAASDDDVFQRRPAFPLACTSSSGLVVAAIVSLYGSVRTRDILENYAPKPAEIIAEIRRLTGLD